MQNAVVVGRNQVGAIAGLIHESFRIEGSWAQGRVVGSEGVGGIVGQIEKYYSAVSLSWFAGDVVGDVAGGLAGEVVAGAPNAIVDSWAMARVRGATVGGLFGSESLNDNTTIAPGATVGRAA